jgi:integrase
VPSSVSQRYSRLAQRLRIDTHLHALQHYSATELIAAGVDVRTVAGRLGHSGGGTTTLRVYAAWLSESDQRASAGLAARMPARPLRPVGRAGRAMTRPSTSRELLAVELRERILSGETRQVGTCRDEAAGTGARARSVHRSPRAFALLRDWGLIDGAVGERPRVLPPAEEIGDPPCRRAVPPVCRFPPRRGEPSVGSER